MIRHDDHMHMHDPRRRKLSLCRDIVLPLTNPLISPVFVSCELEGEAAGYAMSKQGPDVLTTIPDLSSCYKISILLSLFSFEILTYRPYAWIARARLIEISIREKSTDRLTYLLSYCMYVC